MRDTCPEQIGAPSRTRGRGAKKRLKKKQHPFKTNIVSLSSCHSALRPSGSRGVREEDVPALESKVDRRARVFASSFPLSFSFVAIPEQRDEPSRRTRFVHHAYALVPAVSFASFLAGSLFGHRWTGLPAAYVWPA